MRWLPFQLNPTMPKEGISRKEYRIRKFGSWERSLELDAKVVAVGETEGIHFAFDRIERTPNTLDAHRLIWLADQQGCQDAVVEALFRGLLHRGPGHQQSPDAHRRGCRSWAGPATAEAVLNSDEGMDAIKEAEELSRRFRVDGVPFFIINNEITLSGAQQPDVFLEAFRVHVLTTQSNRPSLKGSSSAV